MLKGKEISIYVQITVERQLVEHIWNRENIFELGVVPANEC